MRRRYVGDKQGRDGLHLDRGRLAKWILRELDERKWVRLCQTCHGQGIERCWRYSTKLKGRGSSSESESAVKVACSMITSEGDLGSDCNICHSHSS
jgi:hypothetical protein